MQKLSYNLLIEVHEERGKRKRAEAKACKLNQQLKYARKNKFGDKCKKDCKGKNNEDEADREDEKDPILF